MTHIHYAAPGFLDAVGAVALCWVQDANVIAETARVTCDRCRRLLSRGGHLGVAWNLRRRHSFNTLTVSVYTRCPGRRRGKA